MTFSSVGRKGLLVAAIVVGVGVLALFLRNEGGGGSEAEQEERVGKVPTRERSETVGGTEEVYRGSVRVEAVLGDESISDREVRDALLVIAKDPAASVDERAEALAHGLILSPNEDMALLEDVVSGTSWPNILLEDFFDDALGRPDPGRLGIMVEILVRAKPPLRSEVEETLGFLLDQDLGEDFEAWRDAVASWSEGDSE